jgi:cytokinin riboside 5'-monophosphate phosphoribohydrolase
MNICVFCSSSNAVPEKYFEQAKVLGALIGSNHHTLVYGGASVGLMHAVAEASREAGAIAIGIIPELIHNHRLSSPFDHEQIITPNMRERKYLMRKRSDAFIALPGGFGTLEEVLEVITLKQLQYHHKPVVLINSYGFYNALIEQFEVAYRESFAKEDYRSLYFIADDADQAIQYIQEYNPVEPTQKWYEVPGPSQL